MNLPFHLPALVRKIVRSSTLTLSALWLSGCDAFFKDFMEDPPPVQGTYKAVVSTSGVKLTALNPSASITLNAVAVGDHLPPNMNLHQPNWTAVSYHDNFLAAAADPLSPSTTVTITYTGNLNPPYDKAGWNRFDIAATVGIYSNNVPEGMWSDNAEVSVRFYYGTDVDEEIAETPRLTVLPARLVFLPGAARILTVTYKGPDATVASAGVSPSGQGFSLSMSPPALKDGVSFQASISYFPTGDPVSGHFTLTTSNGATATIALTGIPP